jgi:hypothetical protein
MNPLFFLALVVWIPFIFLTVSFMLELRNRPKEKQVYRIGVLFMGTVYWVIFVVALSGPFARKWQLPLVVVAIIWAYFLFPVCLWMGFVWGKAVEKYFAGKP